MIIFGVGSKRRDIAVDPQTQVIVMRSFFHLCFFFTVAWNRRFILARLTENGWATQAIAEEQAAQLCGGEAPDIHPWWRFSLLGLFLAIPMAVVVGAVLGSLF